jgi:hypothetical protein
MEMPPLPEGIHLEDLRYVNPEVYPVDMAMKGWTFASQSNLDGNPAKLYYELARPVGEDFGPDELDALAKQMDIREVDGVNYRPGYHLSIDSFRDNPSLARKLGDTLNGAQGPLLVFQFEGFPTEETMQAMLTLEQAFFPQKRPNWLRRLLGKIGFRGASEERS